MGPPPRSLTAEANSCFMVRVPHGPNRIQGCGVSIAPECGLPSDQLYQISNNGGQRVAVTLDTGRIASRRRCCRNASMILSTGATANGPLVHADGAHGKQTVAADLVVHAAGREPDLDVLDLTAAQVRVSKNRLELNEYLQSVSNPLVCCRRCCECGTAPDPCFKP